MAAPVLSVNPSRDTGRAPLGVFFDATGTTDADVDPFSGLTYIWNFGDSDAGNWEFGASQGPRNFATGPCAAHVYEIAGTYTWTCVVWDGTTADVETGTITVTDWPDDANTVCIGNTLPVNGVNGVPSNATVAASSDFDAMIAAHMGTNKRVLFNRGDTFLSSAVGNISSAGPNMVGAYGTGALPIVNATNVGGVVAVNNAAVNDLRIADLDMAGNGPTDTGLSVYFATVCSNVTVLRIKSRDAGGGIGVASSGAEEVVTSLVVQDCDIADYHDGGGNGFYGRVATSAFLGNNIGPPDTDGEHALRIQRGQKFVVANNTLSSRTYTKGCLLVRADIHATAADDSFFGYITQNKIIGAPDSGQLLTDGMVFIRPTSDLSDDRIYDILFEHNWLQFGYTTQYGMIVSAIDVTIRNNLFDQSASAAGSRNGMLVGQFGVEPAPDNVNISNNTFYASDAGLFRGIWVEATAANSIVRNNLAYYPSSTGLTVCLLDQSGTTTDSTNTGDVGTVTTNPAFTGPMTEPIGFTISAASYGANGGTASFPAQQSDFFNALDKSDENRMGAIVQNGEQQIKGVAA